MPATQRNTDRSFLIHGLAGTQPGGLLLAHGNDEILTFGMRGQTGQFANVTTNTVFFVGIDSAHGLPPRMLNAKDIQFHLIQAYTTQLISVAAQAFDGV